MNDLLGLHDALSGLSVEQRSQGFWSYKPYQKQREFHAAGSEFRMRMLMGGNQTGKTLCGASEVGMHCTGLYPDWWEGKRFNHPIVAMVGSEDYGTNKKGVQRRLLGRINANELGLASWDAERSEWIPCAIPHEHIISIKTAGHDSEAVATAKIRHATGGTSLVQFYTYAQGRKSLQAESANVVWSDEEPDEDIYTELIARTAASRGIYILTFTPLLGRSQVVNAFLDDPDRCHVRIAAVDAPHMSEQDIAELKRMYPRHEHKARLDGHPAMGVGAVWPYEFDDMLVNPFNPPPEWFVCDGVDFGSDHPTARARVLHDPLADAFYVAQVYRARRLTIPRHAEIWKRTFHGRVPVAYPKADGNNKTLAAANMSLRDQFAAEGVNMRDAAAEMPSGGNSLEASVHAIDTMMSDGRFFVYRNAQLFVDEAQQYRRTKKKTGGSQIVSAIDDIIDAVRMAIMDLQCGNGIRVSAAFDDGRGRIRGYTHGHYEDFDGDQGGDIQDNDWSAWRHPQ